MAVVLKRYVGEAGAGLDKSMGQNTAYDVMKALAEFQDSVVTQFNALRSDVVGATAFPVTVTATALSAKVTVE